MLASARQGGCEGGLLRGRIRLDLDAAAVRTDDLLHDVEPQPEPLRGLITAPEWLEQTRGDGRRDVSRIAHGQLHALGAGGELHPDWASLAVLERVSDQVGDHL